MRKKTIKKIKEIINETVFRKYWGNRIAMPYIKNGGLGDVTWQQLNGSPADSNSFMSFMALNYYTKSVLDPIHAEFQARLEDIEDTLYPIIPVIKTITAHQTVNTYEVPTLTAQDIIDLYNSVVAGKTTIIHFNPSELNITTDFTVTQANNVEGISIRFIYNDKMILLYTLDLDGETIIITDKKLELYSHSIHIVVNQPPTPRYELRFNIWNTKLDFIDTYSKLSAQFYMGEDKNMFKFTVYIDANFDRYPLLNIVQTTSGLVVSYIDSNQTIQQIILPDDCTITDSIVPIIG